MDISRIRYRSATGSFLIRTYDANKNGPNSPGVKRNTEHLELVEKGIRDAASDELAILVKYKKMTPQERDERLEQLVAERLRALSVELAEHTNAVSTRLARCYESGAKLRLETLYLDNVAPLTELRRQIQSGELSVEPAVTAWDGKECTLISRNRTDDRTFGNVKPENPMGPNPVFTLGRLDPKQPPINVISFFVKDSDEPVYDDIEWDGEKAIKVRIIKAADPKSYLEFIILPKNGNSFALIRLVVGGNLMSSETNKDFRKTSLGFWFPCDSARESYGRDDQSGKIVLKLRSEYLAVDPPSFDIDVDDALFNLKNDARFNRLKRYDLLEKPPERSLEPIPEKGNFNYRMLLILLNVLVVCAIFAYGNRRRRNT
ncbi:MAG: hypothetical protein WCJ09_21745 [Planctomycetota bacterium]